MRVVIVDHQDSFTGNLYQDLGTLAGAPPRVIDSRRGSVGEVLEADADLLVLSAGPGHPAEPADAGLSPALIQRALGSIPMFGVCLGLQLLVTTLGGRVRPAAEVIHGKSRPIHHDGSGLFQGLPSPVTMMRYHSLVADRSSLPEDLRVVAEASRGEVMAVAHRSAPVWAVQFHPESVGSPLGRRVLANVLTLARGAARTKTLRGTSGDGRSRSAR